MAKDINDIILNPEYEAKVLFIEYDGEPIVRNIDSDIFSDRGGNNRSFIGTSIKPFGNFEDIYTGPEFYFLVKPNPAEADEFRESIDEIHDEILKKERYKEYLKLKEEFEDE